MKSIVITVVLPSGKIVPYRSMRPVRSSSPKILALRDRVTARYNAGKFRLPPSQHIVDSLNF